MALPVGSYALSLADQDSSRFTDAKEIKLGDKYIGATPRRSGDLLKSAAEIGVIVIVAAALAWALTRIKI